MSKPTTRIAGTQVGAVRTGWRGCARFVHRVLTPAALIAAAAMTGCEADDWLINPSTVGRWQHTPTIVPVLERIDVIESDSGDFVDVTQVTPEDLIPEPRDYLVSPGDVLRIQVLDLLPGGSPLRDDYLVDQRGYVNIPLLEPVFVSDKTAQDAQRAIADALIKADILDAPQVNVIVVGQRQATVAVYGAISNVGRYQIPSPDYRLLDALTDAGGVSPVISKVYVIRQVPLSEEIKRGSRRDTDSPASGRNRPDESGEDLLKLIESLTAPEGSSSTPPPPLPPSSPGVVGMSAMSSRDSSDSVVGANALQPDGDGGEPIIDLPDDVATPAPVSTAQSPAAPVAEVQASTAKWVFLDGEWVKVMRSSTPVAAALPEAADPLATAQGQTGELVTQRVIEVPTAPLMQGIAQYNIVIRPGDVIHVPSPDQGNVYLGGPGIARPGTYNLPFAGRLTLTRLVFAAGGLSSLADPNRVDLTRMIGTDRQATVRLNVKAIFEGTQPDIFIKPDDMLNFGTNFWALPLAVIRGGFRTTYGFGFLLDRNFGNDVFGPPPDSDGFN